MSTATVNIPSQVLNYANLAAFPVTGALKTIYIAEDSNLEYRWTGSAYQLLGAAGSGVQSVTGDGVNNTDPLNPVLTFPTPNEIGLGNVDNTSDVNKPISSATQTALDGKEDETNKGIANGYASLDSSAKIPLSQIPDSVLGQVEYQGTWNASTNTPTLATPTGVKGYYYVVSVAGTYLGIDYNIGDWVISNGTSWEKVDNTDAVSSVAGLTGIISSASLKTALDLSGTNTGDETAATIGAIVNGTTNYTTPLDPDKIGIWDVANSLFKALTWANLKATLKTYFDTIYLSVTNIPLYEDLHAYHLALNFADSTTYYFASRAGTAPTTGNVQRLAFKKAGTITGADIYVSVASTLASGNEDSTVSIRLNDSTDLLLSSSVKMNARAIAYEITGLSQAFSANDDWAVKLTTPAFSINPAGPTITVVLHVKYT